MACMHAYIIRLSDRATVYFFTIDCSRPSNQAAIPFVCLHRQASIVCLPIPSLLSEDGVRKSQETEKGRRPGRAEATLDTLQQDREKKKEKEKGKSGPPLSSPSPFFYIVRISLPSKSSE